MSAREGDADIRQLCAVTLAEIELYMPGVVRALEDIYREHITHERIKFVIVAVPSTSYDRAVIGTNFQPGQSAIVRELLRGVAESITHPLVLAPPQANGKVAQ